MNEEVENKEKALMDIVGSALLDLGNIKNTMPGILEKIHEKKHWIESNITRV